MAQNAGTGEYADDELYAIQQIINRKKATEAFDTLEDKSKYGSVLNSLKLHSGR